MIRTTYQRGYQTQGVWRRLAARPYLRQALTRMGCTPDRPRILLVAEAITLPQLPYHLPWRCRALLAGLCGKVTTREASFVSGARLCLRPADADTAHGDRADASRTGRSPQGHPVCGRRVGGRQELAHS